MGPGLLHTWVSATAAWWGTMAYGQNIGVQPRTLVMARQGSELVARAYSPTFPSSTWIT